jgi:hypothetical protein
MRRASQAMEMLAALMIRAQRSVSVTRSYASFTNAAFEEGESRIFCGIHFRSAMDAGLTQGRLVADWTIDNRMRPLQK